MYKFKSCLLILFTNKFNLQLSPLPGYGSVKSYTMKVAEMSVIMMQSTIACDERNWHDEVSCLLPHCILGELHCTIYRKIPYKRPLPYKWPSPSISRKSAKRPSKYKYQLNDPLPLFSKCFLRDPGSLERYFLVSSKSFQLHDAFSWFVRLSVNQ